MWGAGPSGFYWYIASPIHIHLDFGRVRFIPPTPSLFFHFITFSLLYPGLSALGASTLHFFIQSASFFPDLQLNNFWAASRKNASGMGRRWKREKERRGEEMENGEKICQARERQKSSLHMFLCWDSFSLPDLTFSIARNSTSGFAKAKM